MWAGQAVDGTPDSDLVVRPLPGGPLDRNATRDAAIDIGERQDFIAAVVPARTSEYTDILADGLLDVRIEAVLGSLPPDTHHDVVDVDGRIGCGDCQRLVIVAGAAAIGENTEPEFSALIVDVIATLPLDHRTTCLENENIAVRLLRHLE